MPLNAILRLSSVKAPVAGSVNAPTAIAMVGSKEEQPRVDRERQEPEQAGPPRPSGRPALPDLGAVTRESGKVGHQPVAVAHCCDTTAFAAVCCASVGYLMSPSGAGGSLASAALSTVPSFTSVSSWIGRAEPLSHRFWPSTEYRYSSQSRAAAGCGAVALIACA